MPDTVEEMCPEMPRLDKLLKDVNDVSESGARYSDMPQVRRVYGILVLLNKHLDFFFLLQLLTTLHAISLYYWKCSIQCEV